jgi:hypothetical protein
MPGGIRRSAQTTKMLERIDQGDYEIDEVGYVSRSEIVQLFNLSKIFLHLGAGGQNDRSVLEALSCGLVSVVGFPAYHTKLLDDIYGCTLFRDVNIDSRRDIAVSRIQSLLEYVDIDGVSESEWKGVIRESFKKWMGFEKAVGNLATLFDIISSRKPSLEVKNYLKSYFYYI